MFPLLFLLIMGSAQKEIHSKVYVKTLQRAAPSSHEKHTARIFYPI